MNEQPEHNRLEAGATQTLPPLRAAATDYTRLDAGGGHQPAAPSPSPTQTASRRSRGLVILALMLTAITVAAAGWHVTQTKRWPEVRALAIRTAADFSAATYTGFTKARAWVSEQMATRPPAQSVASSRPAPVAAPVAPSPAPAPIPAPIPAAPPPALELPSVAPVTAEAAQALAAQLDKLSARLAQLPDRAEAVRTDGEAAAKAAAAAAVQPAEAKLAALEARLAAIEPKLEATEARLIALDGEMAALRRQQDRKVSLLLAVVQLKAAVDEGASYLPEWKSAHALVGDDAVLAAALDRLKPADGGGAIPTVGMLQRRFKATSSTIEKSERNQPAASWFDATLIRFQSLLPFGSVEPAEGPIVKAVHRADEHVARGRIGEAVDELSNLPMPAAELAGPWIEDARRRLEADRTLSELTALALVSAQSR